MSFLRDTLTTLSLAVVLFFGLQAAVQSSVVVGSSMEPSLQIGQWVIIDKVTYRFREPVRGDVMVFHSPENPQEDYIKRVIGLPGESVEVKEGIVYIHKKDGAVLALDESYITEPDRRAFKGDTIPANEYLVLGDNRNISGDSRQGWTVPQQKIIGKAWLSIWPPVRWGLVSNYNLPEQTETKING